MAIHNEKWGRWAGSPASATAWSIILLSPIEWDVSVLDHMLDLPSHGDGEKDAKVHQENGPKDRDIKDAKEAAYNGNHGSLGSRVPGQRKYKQQHF